MLLHQDQVVVPEVQVRRLSVVQLEQETVHRVTGHVAGLHVLTLLDEIYTSVRGLRTLFCRAEANPYGMRRMTVRIPEDRYQQLEELTDLPPGEGGTAGDRRWITHH